MERKLAAILAADVVGYSRLMEQDEAKTFERLKDHRIELVGPEISAHRGCVFKLMGDGLLAEFGSVVDAVECAIDIQRGMAERNAGEPEDHRIDIRIGINLGEVIVEGADRHGEGVNIAARLQQLADPGGICVSGKVAKEVEKKLAFGFEPMGKQKVKNISEPIPVYRVKLDGASLPRRRTSPKSRLPGWARPIAAAMVLLAGLAAAGWYRLVHSPSHLASARAPSIAVLPFDDLSPDKTLGYLGDGMSEDIITMLSRFPDLSVIARNSSFTLQGQPAVRHSPSRPRSQRRLCSRGQRPEGRRPNSYYRPAHRHGDGQACVGRTIRQDWIRPRSRSRIPAQEAMKQLASSASSTAPRSPSPALRTRASSLRLCTYHYGGYQSPRPSRLHQGALFHAGSQSIRQVANQGSCWPPQPALVVEPLCHKAGGFFL